MSDWNSRPNREVTGFVMQWWMWGLALIVVMTVITIPTGWALSWYTAVFRVTSVQNISTQYDHLYTLHNSLQAIAGNVCDAEKAEAEASTPAAKDARASQTIGQRNNYRRVQEDYDQAADNAFKAGVVGRPADLPRNAENLDDMKRQVQACGGTRR